MEPIKVNDKLDLSKKLEVIRKVIGETVIFKIGMKDEKRQDIINVNVLPPENDEEEEEICEETVDYIM
jgi:hypothetical protein